MIKYDPNNPLSDEELDKISKEDFDKFLEYLDSKTEYLKSKTRPLNSHEMKKAMSAKLMKEERLVMKNLRRAKKIGKENEQKIRDNSKNSRNEWWTTTNPQQPKIDLKDLKGNDLSRMWWFSIYTSNKFKNIKISYRPNSKRFNHTSRVISLW